MGFRERLMCVGAALAHLTAGVLAAAPFIAVAALVIGAAILIGKDIGSAPSPVAAATVSSFANTPMSVTPAKKGPSNTDILGDYAIDSLKTSAKLALKACFPSWQQDLKVELPRMPNFK
jgi:hypothetical protein